ncbi:MULTISPECIES: type IV pilus secretin PilQ [Candidatus Ichthyocystis]|uniref:type IV pilus secretin PilQ n=1 Tax=Candidatus Ichthyocystis TaxID=2929841 RepID=UPI000A41A766|nr:MULTISPECIES: type IV pilus secretin PilQ [Ichthyocystis]
MIKFGRDMIKFAWLFRGVVFCILLLNSMFSYSVSVNRLVSVDAIKSGNEYAVKMMFSGDVTLNQEPKVFSVVYPAKIVVDLPDVSTNKPTYVVPINIGDFVNVYVAHLSGKTRLVFSLKKFHPYRLKQEGDHLILSLLEVNAEKSASASKSHDNDFFNESKKGSSTDHVSPYNSIQSGKQGNLTSVDFRKGTSGSGLIVISTNVGRSFIRADRVSDGLLIYLPDLSSDSSLLKTYDVSDFYTPVQKFSITKEKRGIVIHVYLNGVFEDRTFESNGKIVIELKRSVYDDNSYGRSAKRVFLGKKLSLNFQNTSIRGALQAIADFTRLNILVTDSVKGNLTMRLNDVPWDQALNIILDSANLGMRRNGSVIVVGTTKELLESDKQYLQSEKQMNELAQTKLVVFHLNYQKADDVERMFDSKNKILSERGSVIVDNRTNQIFIRDVPDKVKEVRDFIKAIDVPVSQVMIEARIVEASSSFNRSLGIRLGTVGNNNNSTWGADIAQTTAIRNQPASMITQSASNFNVNLPASGSSPGKFAWTIFNSDSTGLLNLEISAMEADGGGKTLSNPRVVTSDKQLAIIEQGTEIPYTTVQGTGANVTLSTDFKKVNLSLSVTPQITPNNHVILDVEVTKDSVGLISTTAGPSINTKHVKTKVLVEDGGTLVIGGIYEDSKNEDNSKIPLLGDFPILGSLFKVKTNTHRLSELMVFITPRVIYDKQQ